MRATDGSAAAVPAALVSAAGSIREVAAGLAELPGTFGLVASAGSCAGTVPAALSGLVRAASGGLGRLGGQVHDLAGSVEAAAADFSRADGQ